MATTDYSLDSMLDFFDRMATLGIMNRNTAMSRKSAATQIFSVLPESQTEDLRTVDLAKAFDRFKKTHGSNYTNETLDVYYSRLKSGLSDFLEFRDQADSAWAMYKDSVQEGLSPTHSSGGSNRNPWVNVLKGLPTKGVPTVEEMQEFTVPLPKPSGTHLVIPVPLREGLTVKISDLPYDLTPQEADKLAAVVRAYAMSGGN